MVSYNLSISHVTLIHAFFPGNESLRDSAAILKLNRGLFLISMTTPPPLIIRCHICNNLEHREQINIVGESLTN